MRALIRSRYIWHSTTEDICACKSSELCYINCNLRCASCFIQRTHDSRSAGKPAFFVFIYNEFHRCYPDFIARHYRSCCTITLLCPQNPRSQFSLEVEALNTKFLLSLDCKSSRQSIDPSTMCCQFMSPKPVGGLPAQS